MVSSNFCQRSFLKTAIVSLIGCVSWISLLNTSSSYAAVENGGFETGDFTGWQTIGRTFIETAGYGVGPPAGTYQARLDTICPALENGSCKPDGNFGELAEFLNLENISVLENLINNQEIFEGSAIKTTITVKAGDVLSFDWNFLTDTTEDSQSSLYNDFAFFSLSSIADKLADTFSTVVNSLTPFENETGFRTSRYTFKTAGTYSLGIGVMDVGDGAVESGLLVDDFVIFRASPVPSASVPEPVSALGLLSFTALGVSLRLLRQR